MKYLSLFSGYGGFELGINKAYEDYFSNKKQMPEQEGLSYPRDSLYPTSKRDRKDRDKYPTCIGFSEIDKYAIQTYLKHFPTHKNYGDIKTINPAELPYFDLLCGGFPCQAFSIAGKRAGFEDTRGTLIYDVFRIIKEKHPKLVLLENVKGLLSHDNGRTFKTIITSLAELGYAVEWQVLNAKNFGVPQNRERVFIVGHLGGIPERKVFPITGQNTAVAKNMFFDESQWRREGKLREYNGISPTINTAQGGGHIPLVVNPYNHKQSEVETGTLETSCGTTTGKTAQLLVKDTRIRRLTPTECERLMGLPDGWTEGVSDTQRYKLCGNGVVVNCVKEIISRLIKNYE